jgi:hypothetical protein
MIEAQKEATVADFYIWSSTNIVIEAIQGGTIKMDELDRLLTALKEAGWKV